MLASAWQGVIAQAHVHARWVKAPTYAGVVLDAPAGATNEGRVPDPGSPTDPASCGLCQALASGTAPLAHQLHVSPLLDTPSSHISHYRAPITGVSAVSYSWTSRGPPDSTPQHS